MRRALARWPKPSREERGTEREGFEPSRELSAPYSLSRRVPSATRPPLPEASDRSAVPEGATPRHFVRAPRPPSPWRRHRDPRARAEPAAAPADRERAG